MTITSPLIRPLRIPLAALLFFVFLVVPGDSPSASGPLENYAQARIWMQKGQYHRALEILREVRIALPLLQDFILFDQGYSLENTGDVKGAIEKYGEIVASHRQSQLYRPAFRRLLELKRSQEPSLALREFGLYLKEFPADARVLLDYARLREETGSPVEALTTYRQVFLSGTPLALPAARHLIKLNRPPGRDDLTQAATRLVKNDHHDEVISLFKLFPPADDEARLTQARAFFNRRRHPEAVQILERLPSREAQVLLASSLLRSNERGRFYALVAKLVKDGQEDAFSLHLSKAEAKRREGRIKEAAKVLLAMRNLYPKRYAEIDWARAWLEIRRRDFPEAERILRDLTGRKSGQIDRNHFWLGKVLAYQGKDPSPAYAKLSDENGFYFLRIFADNLNRNHFLPPIRNNRPPLPEFLQTRYQRISALTQLAMLDRAAQEAQLAFPLIPPEHIDSFAELLRGTGDYHSLTRLGIRAKIPQHRYPLAFWPLVQEQARKNKIDPLLVIALMREESLFRPDAVSRAGALGLMQLMPATAKRLGPLPSRNDLFEPPFNIARGTEYLAKLLKEFQEKHLALAAYNAGAGAVRRWLATSNHLDDDEFIEDIPFAETRAYVMRVLRSYFLNGILWGKYDRPADGDKGELGNERPDSAG